MTKPYWERALAAEGLASYRYRLPGNRYVMIGAKDHVGALREAARSMEKLHGAPTITLLDIWGGDRYVPVVPPAIKETP